MDDMTLELDNNTTVKVEAWEPGKSQNVTQTYVKNANYEPYRIVSMNSKRTVWEPAPSQTYTWEPAQSQTYVKKVTYEPYKIVSMDSKQSAWEVVDEVKPDKVKTTRKTKARKKTRWGGKANFERGLR